MGAGEIVGTEGLCRSLYQAMYPVTHMTIAAGSVWLGARLWRRLFPDRGSVPGDRSTGREARKLDFDYRFVALGALIPDVIDKPLYRVTSIASDHTIGHTLLFSLALVLAGVVLDRRGETRLLCVGLGSLSHPLVDPVIVYPGTLLWPLLGWEFEPSRGIPSWYLRAIDAGLVALGVAAWWSRSGGFRERARWFLSTGTI